MPHADRPPSVAAAGLSRGERLRKRPDFLLVQNEGQRSSTPHFLLFSRPSPSGHGRRLGVTVSKKVGGSVVRNRVKRLLREAFRRQKERWPSDRDVVFVAKNHAAEVTQAEVVRELEQLARRMTRGATPGSTP